MHSFSHTFRALKRQLTHTSATCIYARQTADPSTKRKMGHLVANCQKQKKQIKQSQMKRTRTRTRTGTGMTTRAQSAADE